MNPDDVKKCCDIQPCTFQYWTGQTLQQNHMVNQGHQFFLEAQRAGFLEGKVGMRESVALKNLPPLAPSGSTNP